MRAAYLPGWNSGIIEIYPVENKARKIAYISSSTCPDQKFREKKQAEAFNRFPVPIVSFISLLLVNPVAPVPCA